MGSVVSTGFSWMYEAFCLGFMVFIKQKEYGIYGDLLTINPKPYCIYLRGTIGLRAVGLLELRLLVSARLGSVLPQDPLM